MREYQIADRKDRQRIVGFLAANSPVALPVLDLMKRSRVGR